jgi:hypothetical protein
VVCLYPDACVDAMGLDASGCSQSDASGHATALQSTPCSLATVISINTPSSDRCSRVMSSKCCSGSASS